MSFERRQANQSCSGDVVEANPRLVMAVMAIGMIIGALLL